MSDAAHPRSTIEELAQPSATGHRSSTSASARSTPPAHVPGACSCRWASSPSRLGELDRPRRVYVICATGNRSQAMTDLLRRRRASTPTSVAGGTSAWIALRPPRRGRISDERRPHRRPDRDPHPGRPQLPRPRRRGRASWSTRSATSTGSWPCSTSTASGSPTSSRPTSTTTTSPAASPWPQRTGADVPRQRRRRGLLRPHPDPRRQTSSRSGARMRVTALATPGHTFTHLSYALTDAGTTATDHGRRLLRRLAAVRRHRAPRPARRGAHRRPGPPPARLGPPARRRCCPTTPRSSRPTASARSARPPSPRRPTSTIGQEKQANPVLTQDEETYVRELLAGLGAWPAYYAHMAPGQRRRPVRARPQPARASPTPPSCAAGSRPASGSSTCATAPPSRPGHAPGTLNFGLDGAFATYLGWLIAWGTPVTLLGETAEDVAEAQRELVRIGIDRPAAARHRRARGLDRRRARLASPRPPSPTSPRSATTARWSSSTSAAPTSTTPPASPARSTSRSTSCRGRARRGPRRARSGCTAPAATAPRSPPRCSTPPAARSSPIDDSFDNAEKVGLHLVGPEA